MRAIVQRVSEARVAVAGQTVGEIGRGLLIFLGVGKNDNETHAAALAEKISRLRVFEDEQGKMNRSVADLRGEILVVSQFTLYADCAKGNRPSFADAAPAAAAEALYDRFVTKLRDSGLTVATGRFQAVMRVSLVNDGPVTLFLEA